MTTKNLKNFGCQEASKVHRWIYCCSSEFSSRGEEKPKRSVRGVWGASISPQLSLSLSTFATDGDEKSKYIPCITCSYDAERSWEVNWWYSTSWWRHWFSLVKFAFSFANLDFSASRASNWSLTYDIQTTRLELMDIDSSHGFLLISGYN